MGQWVENQHRHQHRQKQATSTDEGQRETLNLPLISAQQKKAPWKADFAPDLSRARQEEFFPNMAMFATSNPYIFEAAAHFSISYCLYLKEKNTSHLEYASRAPCIDTCLLQLEYTAGNCVGECKSVCIRSSASALLLLAPAPRRSSKASFNVRNLIVPGNLSHRHCAGKRWAAYVREGGSE
jgi:hypothetical protein